MSKGEDDRAELERILKRSSPEVVSDIRTVLEHMLECQAAGKTLDETKVSSDKLVKKLLSKRTARK